MATLAKNMSQGGKAAVRGVVMVVAMKMIMVLVADMMVAVGGIDAGGGSDGSGGTAGDSAGGSGGDSGSVPWDAQPLHPPLPGLRTVPLCGSDPQPAPPLCATSQPLPCPHKDMVTVFHKTLSLRTSMP